MITPENNSLANEEEADDQRSQQDVQSDGIDPIPPTEEDRLSSEIDNLAQADRAAEASYTLNLDAGIAPQKKKDQ